MVKFNLFVLRYFQLNKKVNGLRCYILRYFQMFFFIQNRCMQVWYIILNKEIRFFFLKYFDTVSTVCTILNNL